MLERGMAESHTLHLKVVASEIDANGHVNNVEYLRWMQQAAIAHADSTGCTAATRAAGASWVVRSHFVEYLRPAFLDEEIAIFTWVTNFRKVSSVRKYRIRRVADQVVLAEGETHWVFVDETSGRPRAIPPEVSTCLPVSPENGLIEPSP